MEDSLDMKSFPVGFRFHPTNQELILYYLKMKVLGIPVCPQIISELEVNNFAPWDLPAMAYLKSRERNWYFFCPRSKKYPNGGRVNRSSKWGYWKPTGEDKDVVQKSRVVGKIKHLVFHRGKAPKGERTNWVMHEYRLEDEVLADKGVPHDSYVICKVFEKSGVGPKNGEDYGAHFVEEEWEMITDYHLQQRKTPTPTSTPNTFTAATTATVTYSSINASMGAPAVTPFTAAATASTTSSSADAFMGAPIIITTPVDTSCGHVGSAAAAPFTAAPTANFVFTSDPTMPATAAPFTGIGTSFTNIGTTSFDGPVAVSLSVDVANASTTSMGSTSALPTAEDEEVDRLLHHFTEDAGDSGDVYIGWEDLFGPSVQHINRGDSYIEMNDL